MMRVIFAFLALQHSSAVLLGKTSHKSNDTDYLGEQDWHEWEYVVKTEIAPLASPHVDVSSEVVANINHVIYVHRRDADKQIKEHGYYAYAFVNVDLNAAEKYILDNHATKTETQVLEVQSQFAGKELFKRVIDDSMSESTYDKENLTQCVDRYQEYLTRTHTEFHTNKYTYDAENVADADKDIRIVRFQHGKNTTNQRFVSWSGLRNPHREFFDFLEKWGLNAHGQMAFLQMVKQMKINKRLDMSAVPKALLETSNEIRKAGTEKIMDVLTMGCQKARDS